MSSFVENSSSLFFILGIFSALRFFCSLALVPWIMLRIPANYFSEPQRVPALGSNWPHLIRWTFILLKNAAGILILLVGIAMLILPGQGLMTVLIALILIDFPGKYRLQCSVIRRKAVNWLQKRGRREPLQL